MARAQGSSATLSKPCVACARFYTHRDPERPTAASKGIEITDAAMSQRAECVMLNKGPYVLDAIRVLDDILRRMDAISGKRRRFCGRCMCRSWGELAISLPPSVCQII